MSGVIDTNILLYAANEDAEENEKAVSFLRETAESPTRWYLTEGIVYEFLRVATHPRVFPSPLTAKEALRFIRALLSRSTLAVLGATERHWDLLEVELASLVRPAGNLLFDIRTVTIMRDSGVRTIYTTDTDFLQFRGIRVVNPLA
jgi:hypothetical protein